jgi:16S rRNA C967 or C1407 C5-methylase (RsmB/RsmF family)
MSASSCFLHHHVCTNGSFHSCLEQILDMCAAPGSKTAQLIELLHAEDGKLPSMLLSCSNSLYDLLSC